MTDAYKSVMKYIRRTSVRARSYETARPAPWVGQDAVKQHRSAVALEPNNEWYIDGAG